jgi:hypothetical protein
VEVKGFLRFAKMTGKVPDPENHAAKGLWTASELGFVKSPITPRPADPWLAFLPAGDCFYGLSFLFATSCEIHRILHKFGANKLFRISTSTAAQKH